MKWVRTAEQVPEESIHVLVAMHVTTPYPLVTGGTFHGDYWTVDMITRPVRAQEVPFWAPIVRPPRA